MSTPTVAVSPLRLGLGAVGVVGILWGLWLLRDDGLEALVSLGLWLIGGIIVHDGIIAPITVGVTVLVARLLPPPARMPVVVAFIVWATCTVAFIATLSGEGGKAGNDTILGKPYELTWLVITVLIAAVAAGAAIVRTRRFVGGSAGYDLPDDRPATPQEP